MSLANCPVCGKLFVRTNRNLCTECLQEEQVDFEKVRDYLYENPGSNMEEVSEATGVSVKRIMHFLKDGRLELTEKNVNLVLKCESCGQPIMSGRFCESCLKKLNQGFLTSMAVQPEPEQSQTVKGRMHTQNFRKTKK